MFERFSSRFLQVSTLFAVGAVVFAAGKYRVELADLEFAPDQAEEILDPFVGEIHKIKAVNSKGKAKSTIAVEVGGIREKSSFLSGICVREEVHIKISRYPFSAICLEFPKEGKFLSNGKIRDAARACLDPDESGGIGNYRAQNSRLKLLRDGNEAARLHLVRFTPPDKFFQQLPRKIGE